MSQSDTTPKPQTSATSRNKYFERDSVISNLFFIVDRPFEPSVVPGSYRHKVMVEPIVKADEEARLNAQLEQGLIE